jgi:AcrR family transcriptional regulator
MPRAGSSPVPPSATHRILEAATRRIGASGAAALSIHDVAVDAGVSKALVHYHFHDKDTLLARLVEHLALGLVERERDALAAYAGRHDPLAVDALWTWVEDELRRGEMRVLLELDAYRGDAVRAAARRAAGLRRAAAADTITQLLAILDLRPRVAAELLANVAVAFLDGLAIESALASDDASTDARASAARVAFDVFWLAMLSLAE